MPRTHRSVAPETLRLFRHWRGLSQQEIGVVLDLSANAIQAMEYGEGAPEWVRYALFGWSVMYDGQSPRTVARYLDLPWEHDPAPAGPDGPSPDEHRLAHLDALRAPLRDAEPPATALEAGPHADPDEGDASDLANG